MYKRVERTISLNSGEGRRLLHEACSVDYAPLARHFEGQVGRAFCAVASSVITLNALSGRTAHSQEQFFTPPITAICQREAVEQSGMTLREIGSVLALHGVAVTVEHADQRSVDEFRSLAAQNLGREGDFLIINYDRACLGQHGAGHFSPLAAYHRASDRGLILDVAETRYPPVWVTTPDLFAAMVSIDPTTRRSRGYVAVYR